jgi:hypothetical protein
MAVLLHSIGVNFLFFIFDFRVPTIFFAVGCVISLWELASWRPRMAAAKLCKRGVLEFSFFGLYLVVTAAAAVKMLIADFDLGRLF